MAPQVGTVKSRPTAADRMFASMADQMKTLLTLPRSALRDKAREAGATDWEVRQADADDEDPKTALAKLIILHDRIQHPPPDRSAAKKVDASKAVLKEALKPAVPKGRAVDVGYNILGSFYNDGRTAFRGGYGHGNRDGRSQCFAQ